MVNKGLWCVIWVGLFGVLLVVSDGCAPSQRLALHFQSQSNASYEVTAEMIKDFKFEQPTLGKTRQEQTKTSYTVAFEQNITALDAEGNATADITITGLKVYITSKDEVKFAFDSTNPDDSNKPMAQLLGQKYTIQMTPNGKLLKFDASEAQKVINTGMEKKIAEQLLSEERIRQRHEIPALWDAPAKPISVNAKWTQTVPSPPGLLAPKNFKKTYTFASIENQNGRKVAVITMTASESGQQASSGNTGMGMFAKMFDSSDNYTGKLVYDLQSGQVLDYHETLISTYVAQEMPENAAPDKGPDTLTMGLTHRVHMRKL